MSDTTRKRIATYARRLIPTRFAKRFLRRQDGAAAVEFAFVALPFFALTFAILETSLVFFAGQTLEAAVSKAGRMVMTGQVQQQGFDQAQFKNIVCGEASILFNCSNIYVNVKTYASFAAINSTAPVSNGKLDPSKVTYNPGGPGCIVVVSLYYQWPIYVSLLDLLGNFNGNNRLMAATSVFRVEPYGTAACS